MILDVEETFIVGHDTFFESVSPTTSFGVTFEDDLTTGYFYAVTTEPDLKILNALHVYDVANIADKIKPSKLQIFWTENGHIASLLINDYCHAIFDFKKRIAYSRNGFPESSKNWGETKTQTLTNDLLNTI